MAAKRSKLKPEVEFEIDGRTETLRYSQNLFLYRCSSINQDLDFKFDVRSFATVINVFWALLVDHSRYPSPEALVEKIDISDAAKLIKAVEEAIDLGAPADSSDSEEKKTTKANLNSGRRAVLNSA